jgi:hypothetical protein
VSLTAYLKKRLTDLLEEKRVVVWYDGEEAFGEIARTFKAPNSTVILSQESRLRSRRQADEILIQLNDANQTAQAKSANLLIYCPWPRGRTEEQRREDLFESFALIGTAYGDKEAEMFQSLARQALSGREREIDRLFAEARPTLSMIEGLGKSIRYPLIQEALGSDSLIEVTTQLLCGQEPAKELEAVTGASNELLRLLQTGLGFAPPPRVTALESILEHLGRYVLFSEFALDLQGALPDQLTDVARAPEEYRQTIYSLCDRMRMSDDARDCYISLAGRVENALRLADLASGLAYLGVRDTFPFEEKAYLKRLESLAKAGNLTEARQVVSQRRQSVWRYIPERALIWKLAERCVDFLIAAEEWKRKAPKIPNTVRDLVQTYTATDGFWQTDRQQRLVEQGAAACAEDDEVGGLIAICRQQYAEVVGSAQSVFLKAVEREGWPPEGILRQTQVFNRYVAPELEERAKVVYFLVDSMRYEMGRDLGGTLESFGSVAVSSATTILPTTTPCAMAALMPGADGVYNLVEDRDEIVPAIAGKILRNSADRMDFIRAIYGDRFREFPLSDLLSMPQKKLQATIGEADLVVVRTQEIDALGEGPSPYLARKLMSDIIGDVRTTTDRLAGLGFGTFVYAADHGHVLLPEIAAGSIAQQPPGEWKMVKRRSLLGSSISRSPGVTIMKAQHVGITGPVQEYAVPSGLTAFVAGHGYFHEGLSLQECIVPVVVLKARGVRPAGSGREEVEIRYRSDRFTSRVVGVKVWFNSLLSDSLTVRVEAYDGSGAKAKLVGEAADCEARDPATRLVTLNRGVETQVPVRIQDDFTGANVEIRATDAATGAVFHRLKLKSSIME